MADVRIVSLMVLGSSFSLFQNLDLMVSGVFVCFNPHPARRPSATLERVDKLSTEPGNGVFNG